MDALFAAPTPCKQYFLPWDKLVYEMAMATTFTLFLLTLGASPLAMAAISSARFALAALSAIAFFCA